MFQKQSNLIPARVSDMMRSAEAAARAIPPGFPLEATVAVNPFLGQTSESLATASARLMRVAGVRITRRPEDYNDAIHRGEITDADLAEALHASTEPRKPASVEALKQSLSTHGGDVSGPLPTIADLAAETTGIDWPSVIEKTIGLWAAGHFDKGQALWSPAPGLDVFSAWRAWAVHDLTPEIAGLAGFCAHVSSAPDTGERAILRASAAIGLSEAAAETAFHRLYMDLGGWSQQARWQLWQAEIEGLSDTALTGLLAIRLIWEEALLAHAPEIADAWAETVSAHAAPIEPSAGQVALAILQEAADRAHQRMIGEALDGAVSGEPKTETGRPFLQAAFCIDVRSEVFRRALEGVDPSIETIGFAGFFGLPISHKAKGSDVSEAHLPVLLKPAIRTTSHCDAASEHEVRIAARTSRAWGRFRQAAVSSFAFIEAAGPLYAAKLVRDALGLGGKPSNPDPAPQLVDGLSAEAKIDTAHAVLKAMSLTEGHGNYVLLLGHGGHVTNNPHESAYHCGACGGYTGEVSARVLATLLNDPETRAGLAGRGMAIPKTTRFIAGLHDTTTDSVTLYKDGLDAGDEADFGRIEAWLDQAGRAARSERSLKLPGSTPKTVAERAFNWAEVRPEWGLAGCAAFIAAPRAATAGKDLGGRAFLHSYDWKADEGFATLELILTAPVVVASWISLQYYGSTVAPDVFGGGNKLIHNVVGGIGVVEGNGGVLRPGLPLQSVHDGEKPAHEPLRLSVLIEAPCEAIGDVLERHPEVRALFDNGWLHLFALTDGKIEARYRPGLSWSVCSEQSIAA
ncbi:YbcC family protein [Hoeflea sp.]|uniref:YbcC family protein n=1 Tax=Hoeflea sp. TaxID=1940281 RepID=UPI003B51E0D0